MRYRLLTGIAFALIFAIGQSSLAFGAESPAQIAARKGDFPHMSLEEASVLLKKSKGKVVLVNFFATWCPPCQEEIPGLVNVRNTYTPEELLLISLSVDEDIAEVKEFAQDMGFNYPVYVAGEGLAALYRVRSIPHNVLYNKAGELVASEAGFIPEDALREVIDVLVKE